MRRCAPESFLQRRLLRPSPAGLYGSRSRRVMTAYCVSPTASLVSCSSAQPSSPTIVARQAESACRWGWSGWPGTAGGLVPGLRFLHRGPARRPLPLLPVGPAEAVAGDGGRRRRLHHSGFRADCPRDEVTIGVYGFVAAVAGSIYWRTSGPRVVLAAPVSSPHGSSPPQSASRQSTVSQDGEPIARCCGPTTSSSRRR